VAVRVVRLGTPRQRGEGLRLGTVRHLPRGVRKVDYAKRDFFDLWLPELAPSTPLVKTAMKGMTAQGWRRFAASYRREMAQPGPQRLLAVLAALSHQADYSIGCYCEDESRCHRSLLRHLLVEQGARMS
jgi:uncharacterized protein YeaO (DUF488 family)